MDHLRGRFKAAASMLGVLLDYFPKGQGEATSGADVSGAPVIVPGSSLKLDFYDMKMRTNIALE